MKLWVILASLVLASTAHAQAPGDAELAPPGMTEVAAPVLPPPAPRRWSVGLGVGSLDLAPHHAPDATSNFAVGQLAVRYRATRRLELELALAGGREQLDAGYEGDREVSQAVLGVRFRFAPERRWNWWLMAGMGTLAVARVEASEEERDLAHQSTLQFGVGLERRWHRFALQAELRAVGVAPNEYADRMPVAVEPNPGTMPLPVEPYPASGAEGKSGGQFTFSGNYYF